MFVIVLFLVRVVVCCCCSSYFSLFLLSLFLFLLLMMSIPYERILNIRRKKKNNGFEGIQDKSGWNPRISAISTRPAPSAPAGSGKKRQGGPGRPGSCERAWCDKENKHKQTKKERKEQTKEPN